MTIFELVLHWVALHHHLADDLEHLGASHTMLKYEHFVVDPDRDLEQIYKAVGLDPSRASRSILVERGTNEKYREKYCKQIKGESPAAELDPCVSPTQPSLRCNICRSAS